MRKIWDFISNLGTDKENPHLNKRTIVLSNQLNFIMFAATLLLLITTLIVGFITNSGEPNYSTLRIAATVVLCLINLVIASLGYTTLSRLSLIYFPSVIFLVAPTLLGYIEEESYTYYPYVAIGISIIPQLVLHPVREKFHFWFSLSYFFVLVIFLDLIMVRTSADKFPIVDRINTFYPYYKIAIIGLFLFINANIYYLRKLNIRFEEQLNTRNNELDLQNKELKKQKDEIEKQKDELISKEISTWQKLIKIISHEILNSAIPITNLAGMTSQMLEDESGAVLKPEQIGEEVTGDIHQGLKIIESRTRALINLVKATKSLTQIPRPNFRKIILQELFERISILYQAKFRESHVRFEKLITPPDLYIEADLELIEQVIINLIQNALEAMRETPDPLISIVALRNDSGQIQISISDNGTGIGDDVIERIFLPFYSTKANSSGIGLSLSQQIMMLHHARLEVGSGLNNGASFTMIF
jgi:signal transduction histidine kinase